MRTIQVNTKDCSPLSQQEQQQQEQRQRRSRGSQTDSFTLYSDDSIRLKKLLLKDLDDETFDLEEFASRHYGTDKVNLKRSSNSSSSESSSSSSSSPAVSRSTSIDDCNPQDASFNRKTRISFEVHPSLLLDEEFLYGDTNTSSSSSSDNDGLVLDPLESLLLDDDDDSEFGSLLELLDIVNSRR